MAVLEHNKRASRSQIWRKYAPPLPNELRLLEEAFYSLFPIVCFCQHLGARAKYLEECTHDDHVSKGDNWKCRCCQSRRFRNVLGRYIDALYQSKELPTKLSGTKIKNRAYAFRKQKSRLYFSLRRHPALDSEYYRETEQRWCFDFDRKQLDLMTERVIGEYSNLG